MASVAIVGDGPGGLSAALFLAKNGHEATVYGTDTCLLDAGSLRRGYLDGRRMEYLFRRQVRAYR